MSHIHGRPDNQAEHFEDLLGKGGGDPDRWGYPQEHDENCYVRVHGGHGKYCDCSFSKDSSETVNK